MQSRKISASKKHGLPGMGKVFGGFAGIIAGLSFGFGGATSRLLGNQGYTVPHIIAMQFLCAFVILGFLCVFTKKPTLDWKSTCKLMLLGIINTLSSLTYYLAISYLTVGSAVAIQFQYVWIVVAFQAILERKFPRPIVIIAVILVIAGTLFCSGLVDEFISGSLKAHPIGIAFALVCAFTYALFIFFNGKVASDQPPVSRTFITIIGGLFVSVLIGGDIYLQPSLLVEMLPGGILISLIMSVIPILCIIVASTRLPGGLVAILTSMELPAAVFAGVLLFGENVTPFVALGVVMILCSVVLSEGAEMLPSRVKQGAEVNA